MPRELVSVIVPTYNRAYCIVDALRSVQAQTHTDWEVVIVDDGSTDNTEQVIREQFGDDSRVRYVFQKNGGVSNARNTALSHAAGDFIAFLDSDDLWKPWKLEVQLACLRAYPQLGMVWTDMEAVDPDGNVIDPRHLRTMYSAYRLTPIDRTFEASLPLGQIPGTEAAPDPGALFRFGDIYTSIILGNLVHTSTALLRRERFALVKGFDEQLRISGEDYDFHLRTCEFGPVGLIEAAAIQYQKGRPDQLTKHTRLIAQNFLQTVEGAIRRDGTGRIPRQHVRLVLTNANGWVAEEGFKARDNRAVRHHAWQSLRRKPGQPRLIMLFALGCLPVALSSRLQGGLRALKHASRQG